MPAQIADRPPLKFADFPALKAQIANFFLSDSLVVVGVCGLGGAGKTTLCQKIIEEFPNHAIRLSCDSFSKFGYTERQYRIATALALDDPDEIEAEENPRHWYAWDDIGSAIEQLKERRAFSYDRSWNRRTGEIDERLEMVLPSHGPAVLLCDGIYLQHSPVREWFDTLLYVDTPLDITVERGRIRSANNGVTGFAASMERLTRAYTIPYFTNYALKADWVVSGVD